MYDRVHDVAVTAESSLGGSLDSVCPVYVNYVDKSSSPTTGRVSLNELKDLVSRITAQSDTLQQEFNVCRLITHSGGIKTHHFWVPCQNRERQQGRILGRKLPRPHHQKASFPSFFLPFLPSHPCPLSFLPLEVGPSNSITGSAGAL